MDRLSTPLTDERLRPLFVPASLALLVLALPLSDGPLSLRRTLGVLHFVLAIGTALFSVQRTRESGRVPVYAIVSAALLALAGRVHFLKD